MNRHMSQPSGAEGPRLGSHIWDPICTPCLPESSPVSPVALWSQPLLAKTHQTETLWREQMRVCLPLPVCLSSPWCLLQHSRYLGLTPLVIPQSTSPAPETLPVQDEKSPHHSRISVYLYVWGLEPGGSSGCLTPRSKTEVYVGVGVGGGASTCICDHVCANVQLSVPLPLSLNQCRLHRLPFFQKVLDN